MPNIVNYKAFHVKHRKFRFPFDIEKLSNYKKVKLRVLDSTISFHVKRPKLSL